MKIQLTAPAKLTLTLRIIGLRADGYHLLDAEMVSVDLVDRVTITPGGRGVEYRGDEHSVGDVGADLVSRALELCGREARVLVDKLIPPGAGLGGGSSDAAAVLHWAGFDDLEAASALGADIPFCIGGGRARVGGIGEVVTPLAHEPRSFTLLTPPFGCATPAVYHRWDEMGGPRGENGNDLEPAATDLAPRLREFRDRLEQHSGRRARLAGSGSTWFVEGDHPGPGFRVVRSLPHRGNGRSLA